MNLNREPVECHLADYYAGDWIDQLDDLKTKSDERDVINYAGDDSDGLTRDKVLAAFELLGIADVPDDGQRYAVVGWKQWSDLLSIDEFANADYVGPDDLPWRGTQAKRWLGTLWIPHSGLSVAADVRLCHWYHKTAVGHAVGAEVKTDITWHGDRAAYFVANMMSQGACIIDEDGVVTMRCLEA